MVKSILRKLEVKSNDTVWDNQKSDNQDTTVLDASTLTVEYSQI
jgi:hypothetical protein